jgi:hypothetical protein
VSLLGVGVGEVKVFVVGAHVLDRVPLARAAAVVSLRLLGVLECLLGLVVGGLLEVAGEQESLAVGEGAYRLRRPVVALVAREPEREGAGGDRLALGGGGGLLTLAQCPLEA